MPGSSNEAFNAAAQRVLYHCIPVAPQGDAIHASTNYGTTIPPEVREKLGMGEGQVPLVFAATHFSKALAFAMPRGQGILNCAIPGTEAELYIGCDRDNMLAKKLDATFFSFSDEGFVQLPNAERQSVALNAVPFSRTTEVLKARSLQDLMRAGLQILQFRETSQALYKGNFDDNLLMRIMKERGQPDMFKCMGDLIKEGTLVWENKAAGLNPNPDLAKAMGVELEFSHNPKPVAPQR